MSIEIVFRFYNHSLPDSPSDEKENTGLSMNDTVFQIAEKVEDAILFSQQKEKDKKVQSREERKAYYREIHKRKVRLSEANKFIMYTETN